MIYFRVFEATFIGGHDCLDNRIPVWQYFIYILHEISILHVHKHFSTSCIYIKRISYTLYQNIRKGEEYASVKNKSPEKEIYHTESSIVALTPGIELPLLRDGSTMSVAGRHTLHNLQHSNTSGIMYLQYKASSSLPFKPGFHVHRLRRDGLGVNRMNIYACIINI